MMHKQNGVTLIELMVVVAIVGILAAIAYPSYRSQLLRSHRTEAKAEILKIQVAQEKYFLSNNAYSSALTNLGYATASPSTDHGYYALRLTGVTSTTYTATATANTSQSADTTCYQFIVDQTGSRTSKDNGGTITTGCW